MADRFMQELGIALNKIRELSENRETPDKPPRYWAPGQMLAAATFVEQLGKELRAHHERLAQQQEGAP